jgi:hypothetical protein
MHEAMETGQIKSAFLADVGHYLASDDVDQAQNPSDTDSSDASALANC